MSVSRRGKLRSSHDGVSTKRKTETSEAGGGGRGVPAGGNPWGSILSGIIGRELEGEWLKYSPSFV